MRKLSRRALARRLASGGDTDSETVLRIHCRKSEPCALHRHHERSDETSFRTRHCAESIHQSRFTAKYKVDRIVYYETFNDVHMAIAREKQIKGWRRSKKKIALIETTNPNWREGGTPWLP